MKNTFPQLSSTVYSVKDFFTIEVLNGFVFDLSIIELDKILIENKLADKRNRFAVMVEGELSDGDKYMCQFQHDNKKGTYLKIGTTLAGARDIIKDITLQIENYCNHAVKAEQSRTKGNNFYIRLEQRMRGTEKSFMERWGLKIN